MYRKYLKRFFDFSFALFVLIMLSPILSVVFLLLLVNNNGKAFFVQERPGLGGVLFKIIKFKTMTDETDSKGILLPDKSRLTWLGSLIRKTSIDEIPQLINVLKGEMSLIGPRPLLKQYLSLYNEYQFRRHEVKPGITGWAQVNGRNAISWKQKFDYDVWYVDNLSVKLDLKIFILTVKKVFVREGISADGHATVEAFKGNKNG